MEKMNQVSVSEFFAKSKEEMYDNAVAMVEKYNRLVDICNDGCERIADLVIERDNLSKGVQKLIGEREDLIERHNVYTSALNNDLADKAAKIDLLEKEIEGRKEGYIALKKRMDTDYISIDEHNNICKAYEKKVAELEKELADCKVKIGHQKENLDGINKTLEIRTKENERLIAVKNNQAREIEAHESENKRLTEKVIELKKTIEKCKDYDTSLMDSLRINNDDLKEQVSKLKKERDKHMARVNDLRMELDCVKASKEKHEDAARDKTIEDFRESINYWRTHCLAAEEARDAFMKEAGELHEEVESLHGSIKRLALNCNAKNTEIETLKTQVKNLEKELETATQYKDFSDGLNKDLKYWKDQERIRTDQLRATERKVDELWRLVNELKKEKKEGDDYVKSGFKLYVKNTLAEAEGDKNEANEIITEAVRSAYTEWGKEQKEKEEETEVKSVGRTSSGRYPWGAKVNDIPCGEDAIE